MSLTRDGFWKVGFWNTIFWKAGFWYERNPNEVEWCRWNSAIRKSVVLCSPQTPKFGENSEISQEVTFNSRVE